MKSEQTQALEGLSYSPVQAQKLMDQLQNLRDAQPSIQLDLGVFAEQLTVARAKTFATEGLGRRLSVIERAVLNVFRIYPPDRRSILCSDECTDIAIQLHAFAVNVYALFDNIAWVCVLEAKQNLAPEKIGPFKRECQVALPEMFRAYLDQATVRAWFRDYGKVYRDSTAHRIPPYLPSRVMTTEEVTRWQDLDAESKQVIAEGVTRTGRRSVDELLEHHEKLEFEKHALGRNSLLMGLSLSGQDATPPVYLHPQLLCDWGLAHELISAFTKAMRETQKWPAPSIPPMAVRGPI